MVVGLCGNDIRIIFGLRPTSVQVLQTIQEIGRRLHRQHAGVALRHDHAVLVDRIRRIRRHDRVAGPHHREQQVRQRVLRPDRDDGFRIRIEIDVVIRLVPLDDLLAQLGNTLRLRVAMIARVARRLDHLVHDDPRRGPVRVAHSEIDHILLRRSCLCLHLIDDGEHVRRQFLDAIKFLVRTRLVGIGHEFHFTIADSFDQPQCFFSCL